MLGDRNPRDLLYLAMVAVLPLHTVFVSAWISWKPFMVLVAVLAVWDAADGIRERVWPWHRRVTLALLPFAAVILAGWPGSPFLERYFRLGLALIVGVLVLVVSERMMRTPGMFDRTLRTVYLSGGVMAASGFFFSVVAVGAFGEEAIRWFNDLPLVHRFSRPAYLADGFQALTNWHQDPGYGAAWTALWAALALAAIYRGQGSKRPWIDGVVVGGLILSAVMSMSRTGWLAMLLGLIGASVLLVWRGGMPLRALAVRLGVAVATTAVLLGALAVVDQPGEGGDLEVQFAFRLGQFWDFLGDATGLVDPDVEFSEQFDESEQRADVWPWYVDTFLDHPVLGVGLSVGWQTNPILQEPHNLFLELAAETGILGLATFGFLLVVILASGGGTVGLVGLFVAFLPAMTQTVLFEPTWWFAAALHLAARHADTGQKLAVEAAGS